MQHPFSAKNSEFQIEFSMITCRQPNVVSFDKTNFYYLTRSVHIKIHLVQPEHSETHVEHHDEHHSSGGGDHGHGSSDFGGYSGGGGHDSGHGGSHGGVSGGLGGLTGGYIQVGVIK